LLDKLNNKQKNLAVNVASMQSKAVVGFGGIAAAQERFRQRTDVAANSISGLRQQLEAATKTRDLSVSYTQPDLTELSGTPANDDYLEIYDTSTDTHKRVSKANLLAGVIPTPTTATFVFCGNDGATYYADTGIETGEAKTCGLL
jgi:hypothetical protein